MELDMKKLGLAIKYSRESANLTQAELAKRVGLSTSAIGMYEKARRIPGIDVLAKIAHVTGKDINDFLFYVDKDGNPVIKDNKCNESGQKQDNIDKSSVYDENKTIAAHSTENKLSKEDIEDVMTILSILKKR